MKPNQVEFQISRLEHALADWRNEPTAYPILAGHGEMERTPNGFKSLDPEAFRARCRRTLEKLRSLAPF